MFTVSEIIKAVLKQFYQYLRETAFSLNIFRVTKHHLISRWGFFAFDDDHADEPNGRREYGRGVLLGIIGFSYSIWRPR